MENPGALAGATGANTIEQAFKTKDYRNRADAATALCEAIADCDQTDACTIMEAALADLYLPWPDRLSSFAMTDARAWADFATPRELKAYALACFEKMRPKVQAAFLAHVGGAAA